MMKKIMLIILALLWIGSLSILIGALTTVFPHSPFKEYPLIVGLGFLVLTGFVGRASRLLLKRKVSNS